MRLRPDVLNTWKNISQHKAEAPAVRDYLHFDLGIARSLVDIISGYASKIVACVSLDSNAFERPEWTVGELEEPVIGRSNKRQAHGEVCDVILCVLPCLCVRLSRRG